MMRPLALMMPAVTVCSRPKGLPTARTQSPTLSLSLSPRGKKGQLMFGFYLDEGQVGLGVAAYDFGRVLLRRP